MTNAEKLGYQLPRKILVLLAAEKISYATAQEILKKTYALLDDTTFNFEMEDNEKKRTSL